MLEEDLVQNLKWRYLYNEKGDITSSLCSNGDAVKITYDSSGKATKREVTTGANVLTSTYSYNAVNKFLTGIVFKSKNHTVGTLTYAYDAFERASKTLTTSGNVAIPITYSYYGGTESNTTTLIPKTIKTALNGSNEEYRYTYDSNGNISKVERKTTASGTYSEIARYTYDGLNQLVREDNALAGKTFVYSYDKGGNILSAKEYAYALGTLGTVLSTKTYSYGDSNWKDKLTSYDGSSISYDQIGNPLSYRGMSFTWESGRQLASAANGGVTTTYTYNSSGVRTSKTVGSVKSSYTLDGDKVVKSNTAGIWTFYYYDETGSPIAFRTNETGTAADYYYVKNLQGDIVAIVNASGTKVAEYTYDAWGKVLSVTGSLANSIGASNPYRYRGYWYDTETGLYYLQSRYYDPTTGRFINADGYVSTGQGVLSCNMFAYCEDNPVMGYDPEGTFDWNVFLRGVSIALVGIAAIASVVTAGCAAPVLAATVAVVSGTACIGFGASEIAESVTGHNVIRDDLMGGDEKLYNTVRSVAEVTATVSTIAVNAGAAINKANNPNGVCFAAGTLVLTSDGPIPIENIQFGDLVMATDPDTGETSLKEVVQLFHNETNEWVHLTVNGEEIICTSEHPFYSPVKGWTAACKLRAGDILVTVNGEYAVLEKIAHELLESPATTYNFEVEGFHTYYVGSTEVLVHNACRAEYHAATRTDNVVQIGRKLTKKQALDRLRNGKDVFVNSKSAAKQLAKKAFGNAKPYSEIHEYIPNAMSHFHDSMNHIYHIFY